MNRSHERNYTREHKSPNSASGTLAIFASEMCAERARNPGKSSPIPAARRGGDSVSDSEPTTLAFVSLQMEALSEQIAKLTVEIHQLRDQSNGSRSTRQFYTVEEAAKLLGRRPYTVRENCREGRIRAVKRSERRGGSEVWSIPSEEIARIKDDGLLPSNRRRDVA